MKSQILPQSFSFNSNDNPNAKPPVFKSAPKPTWYDYMTCVNIGMTVISICILITMIVFGVLVYNILGVIQNTESDLVPLVQQIASNFLNYIQSYNEAVSSQTWTSRGVADSFLFHNDLEAREYARQGREFFNGTKTMVLQLIEFKVAQTLFKMNPFIEACDPREVANVVHFFSDQIDNGNMQRTMEMLLDSNPGSFRATMYDLHRAGLLESLGSDRTQRIIENMGSLTEKLSDPARVDSLLQVGTSVGQIMTDIHNNDFINRTSESMLLVNIVMKKGVL